MGVFAASKAIVLDSGYARRMPRSLDSLALEGGDCYTVPGVIRELTSFTDSERIRISAAAERLGRRLQETRAASQSETYSIARSFVVDHEREQGMDHDPRIARIIYEGLVSPFRIVFAQGSKNKHRLMGYFRTVQDRYAQVFSACDLSLDVTKDRVVVSDGSGTYRREWRVRSGDGLDEVFLEYEALARSLGEELEGVPLEHAEFYNASGVLAHFQRMKERVLDVREIAGLEQLAGLSAKSLLRSVYETQFFPLSLQQVNVRDFMGRFSVELFSRLAELGYRISERDPILQRTLRKAERELTLLKDGRWREVPRNEIQVDVELVSGAYSLRKDQRGARGVSVRTYDSDIEFMVVLGNRCVPDGQRIECVLMKER